jgi:hypothetical protein
MVPFSLYIHVRAFNGYKILTPTAAACSYHRIFGQMRNGSVAPFSSDIQHESVRGSHDSAGLGTDSAYTRGMRLLNLDDGGIMHGYLVMICLHATQVCFDHNRFTMLASWKFGGCSFVRACKVNQTQIKAC